MGCTFSSTAADASTTSNPSADRKPSLLVLGSSGYCGVATVKALTAKYKNSASIQAGVRDVNYEKNEQLKIDGVELVAADMSKPETLGPAMVGKDCVFIVTPGSF